MFLFLSYSFRINTLINSSSSLENHTRFQTKMGKIYIRFQTKTAQALPDRAAHTYIAYIREYLPGLAFMAFKDRFFATTWYNSLWLWRWLPHRLSKRQSLSTTTVLFRTTFTRTIKLNLLSKWLLGSNLSQLFGLFAFRWMKSHRLAAIALSHSCRSHLLHIK